MKASALITTLFLLIGPVDFTEAAETFRAKMRVQIATERLSKSHTILFTLEEGAEKNFGSEYPKLKVLVLPRESDQMPLQISLVAESGQTISSIIVYFTPESGAEFSLDADGIDAQGKITSLSN